MDLVQNEILSLVRATRFSPLTGNEISQKIDLPTNELQSILNILVNNHKLVNISRDIYLEFTIWEELLLFLRKYFEKQNEMPVASLKEFINTTRKYAIPIFEYLDSQGYTIREGDVRRKGHNL
jgi:selenocysteine-specific elongation factor